jgi:CheY-like chemotaxis protein
MPNRIRPSLKVLVVDDHVDSARTFSQLLKWVGCTTHEVNAAAEVIDAAKAFRPNVILLDIGLPGRDGYQVARLIRQTPELSQVRLIALAGCDQPEYSERSQAAGFDDRLVKPVEISCLIQKLSAAYKAS